MLREHHLMDYSILLQVGRTLPSRKRGGGAGEADVSIGEGTCGTDTVAHEAYMDCSLPPVDVPRLLKEGRTAEEVWRAFRRGRSAMCPCPFGDGDGDLDEKVADGDTHEYEGGATGNAARAGGEARSLSRPSIGTRQLSSYSRLS